jgi:hypothetical protein
VPPAARANHAACPRSLRCNSAGSITVQP